MGMTLESNIVECLVTSISSNIYKKKKEREKTGIEQLGKINESLPLCFSKKVGSVTFVNI